MSVSTLLRQFTTLFRYAVTSKRLPPFLYLTKATFVNRTWPTGWKMPAMVHQGSVTFQNPSCKGFM